MKPFSLQVAGYAPTVLVSVLAWFFALMGRVLIVVAALTSSDSTQVEHLYVTEPSAIQVAGILEPSTSISYV